MKQLKNLQYIFVFLIILLVLVLVRSFNPNLFKQDPGKAVDAAQNNSNSITLAQLKALRTKYLVINLGNGDKFDSIKMKNSLNIPIENLLDKANLTIFKESKDEIILYSSDESTTAKAWVLSLIHISEPTRLGMISYAVFCLKKKKKPQNTTQYSAC